MSEYNISNIDNLTNNYKSNVLFIIEKIQNEMYWCKNYILPGITMTPTELNILPNVIKKPSNNFVFDDLTLDFHIDENLDNYKSIYDWLIKFYFGIYTDNDIVSAQLLLFDTSLNNVVKRVRFNELFPVSINSLEFDNLRNDEENIMNITFSYTNWEFKT